MYWWSSSQRSPSRTAIRLTPSCSHSSVSDGSRSSGRNSYSRIAVSSRPATCSPSRCRSGWTPARPAWSPAAAAAGPRGAAAAVRGGGAAAAAPGGAGRGPTAGAGPGSGPGLPGFAVVIVPSQDDAVVHDGAVGGVPEDQREQRSVWGVELGRADHRVAVRERPQLVALVLAEQRDRPGRGERRHVRVAAQLGVDDGQ